MITGDEFIIAGKRAESVKPGKIKKMPLKDNLDSAKIVNRNLDSMMKFYKTSSEFTEIQKKTEEQPVTSAMSEDLSGKFGAKQVQAKAEVKEAGKISEFAERSSSEGKGEILDTYTITDRNINTLEKELKLTPEETARLKKLKDSKLSKIDLEKELKSAGFSEDKIKKIMEHLQPIIKSDNFGLIHKNFRLNEKTLEELKKNSQWYQISIENIDDSLKGKISEETLNKIKTMLPRGIYSKEKLEALLKDLGISREEIEKIMGKLSSVQVKFEKEDIDKLRDLMKRIQKNISRKDLRKELEKIFDKVEEKNKIDIILTQSQLININSPNYRETDGIYGTALPSVDGIKRILEKARAEGKPVKWINLREEPSIYINGKPYSLRQLGIPWENFSDRKITAEEIEAIEEKIRDEIIKKGTITIYEEVGDKLLPHEVAVNKENVKTTRQTFEQAGNELKKKYPDFQFTYERIPVTDEMPPDKVDVNDFWNKVHEAIDSGNTLIFNCHAGQGRTTTGMLMAALMKDKKPLTDEDLKKGDKQVKDIFSSIKALYSSNDSDIGNDTVDNLLKMIQAKDGDSEIKKRTDRIIDQYAYPVNLREDAIEGLTSLKNAINHLTEVKNRRPVNEADIEKAKERVKSEKNKALEFVKRYFLVIAYKQYLAASDQRASQKPPDFKTWLEKNYTGTDDNIIAHLRNNPDGNDRNV